MRVFREKQSINAFKAALSICIVVLDSFAQQTPPKHWSEVLAALEVHDALDDESLRSHLNQQAAQAPLDFELQRAVAAAFMARNLYREALKPLERIVQANPEEVSSRQTLARLLSRLKLHTRAIDEYRALSKLAALEIPDRYRLATALYALNRPEEALAALENLPSLQDDWGHFARLLQGFCLYDLRRDEQAVRVLQIVLAQSPDERQAAQTLGKALYRLKRYEEALAIFDGLLIEVDNEDRDPLTYYRAASLEGLGQSRQAYDEFNKLGKGNSIWSEYARDAVRRISGKPYNVVLDLSAGYDTGIVDSGEDSRFIGGADYFSQIFLDISGRVAFQSPVEVWLGIQHYALRYPELNRNDYQDDAFYTQLVLKKTGLFEAITLRYDFKYAHLDYRSYRRAHQVDLGVNYKTKPVRLRFGFKSLWQDYFGSSSRLDGPEHRLYLDLRHSLPLYEHYVRVRTYASYRDSVDDRQDRYRQSFRFAYGLKVWKELSLECSGAFRRDDYPESEVFKRNLSHRVDHRLQGEARFELPLSSFVHMNWGYVYEAQDSTVRAQEYGRHQFDLGFTFSF